MEGRDGCTRLYLFYPTPRYALSKPPSSAADWRQERGEGGGAFVLLMPFLPSPALATLAALVLDPAGATCAAATAAAAGIYLAWLRWRGWGGNAESYLAHGWVGRTVTDGCISLASLPRISIASLPPPPGLLNRGDVTSLNVLTVGEVDEVMCNSGGGGGVRGLVAWCAGGNGKGGRERDTVHMGAPRLA